MKLSSALSFALLAVFFSGCTGAASVNYQPANQNVPAGQTTLWNFDNDQVGGLPSGAESFSGNWDVRAESDAPSAPNVLCQTGAADFPSLVLGSMVYANVVVSAHFKPVSGNTDRAAGIIFRIQDRNNYYILRANALEDNIIFFKYVGGQRSDIKGGTTKILSGKWQDLRVEVKGNQMRGFLNGAQVVEATDDTFKAGKIGLWTKADSVTCFDDIQATAQ